MATVLDILRCTNPYPIPACTVEGIAARRGLDVSEEYSQDVGMSSAYRLAMADLFLWLSAAPDVSQGGISYSFTDEQRADFRRRANAAYAEEGDAGLAAASVAFGYKGEWL